MTTRLDAGVTYTQSWDAQNRLQNQRRLDESQTGNLYDFNARFFTPVVARFISPAPRQARGGASIVPNPADPKSLNRFTAMANNPLKVADPMGHPVACEDGQCHSGGGDGSGYTGGGGSSSTMTYE